MQYSLGSTRLAVALAAFALIATLAGCGGGNGSKASQVAVKVNKDEITVLQVNERLARLPGGIPPDQADAAMRQVVDGLVGQQLMVEQALERKLDRDPQVLGALESARMNILAQAYVQRVITPQSKPSEQEIKKYYSENPALFAERKVYRVQELTLEAGADKAKAIEAAAAGAKSLRQFADYLREQKIPFSADSGVRTAEQLPLARVAQIAQMKPGSVLLFPTAANRASALEVLASEAQPVDEKHAAPIIEQFLTNRKREELASADLKRLRDTAKVEYLGEFAKYGSAAGTPATAAAAATPPPAPGATPADKDRNSQDKGIAALR